MDEYLLSFDPEAVPSPDWSLVLRGVTFRRTTDYKDGRPVGVIAQLTPGSLAILAERHPDMRRDRLIPWGYSGLGEQMGVPIKKAS